MITTVYPPIPTRVIRTVANLAALHSGIWPILAIDADRPDAWLVMFDAGYGQVTYVVAQDGKHGVAGMGTATAIKEASC